MGMKLAGLLATVVLLLAGCGEASDAGDAAPRYDVTVIYWPTGPDGESHEATLTCDPDGGSHPDPAGACAALLENADALEPVPGDVACTEIYGGHQVATITGSVEARFSRANGCEIDRWDRVQAVLEIA
jgi:Subtilisin inhibitor-like